MSIENFIKKSGVNTDGLDLKAGIDKVETIAGMMGGDVKQLQKASNLSDEYLNGAIMRLLRSLKEITKEVGQSKASSLIEKAERLVLKEIK